MIFTKHAFIQKIYSLLSQRDKRLLLITLFATVIISFIEIATLSYTIIFISGITNFKTLHASKTIQWLTPYTEQLTNTQILLLLGVSLVALYLFRCVITFGYTYYMQKFLEYRKFLFTFRFLKTFLISVTTILHKKILQRWVN
jgi:hypothetical protein